VKKLNKGQRDHLEWVRQLSDSELEKDKYQQDIQVATTILYSLLESEQIGPADRLLLDRLLAPTEESSEEEANPPPDKKQRTVPVVGAPMDTADHIGPIPAEGLTFRQLTSVIELHKFCSKHRTLFPVWKTCPYHNSIYGGKCQ